ncbi:hypothetical protein GCM10027047_06830 [Rhodococcus aerolatus]
MTLPGLYGPTLALLAVVLLGVLLWWTFGDSRTMPAPNHRSGHGYGLLVEVGRVPTAVAAAELRARLAGAGVKATVSPAGEGGHAVLVFPADEADARTVLARGATG